MMNSNRKSIILYSISFASLLAGFLIYVFFRENTYVSDFIGQFIPLKSLCRKTYSMECNFLMFYFPDFLWALSFSALLHAVLIPGKTGSLLCFAGVSFSGIIFEFSQMIDVISGTADIWDIVSYITASVLISIIYLFLKE